MPPIALVGKVVPGLNARNWDNRIKILRNSEGKKGFRPPKRLSAVRRTVINGYHRHLPSRNDNPDISCTQTVLRERWGVLTLLGWWVRTYRWARFVRRKRSLPCQRLAWGNAIEPNGRMLGNWPWALYFWLHDSFRWFLQISLTQVRFDLDDACHQGRQYLG